jgi:hypothetical protein
MARARLLKPGFFKNETLATLPAATRLLFAGLWCLADKQGRLEDRPARIRAELFAYETLDVDRMLGELAATGFIDRYVAAGVKYIQIPKFLVHQRPHIREAESDIPPPSDEEHQPRHNQGSAEASLGTDEHVPRPPVSDPVPVWGTVSNPVSESAPKTVTVSKNLRDRQLLTIARETLEFVTDGNDEELDDHFRYLARNHHLDGVTKAEVQKALQTALRERRPM